MFKRAAIITLLLLTGCQEERPTLPVVQAAGTILPATYQKPAASAPDVLTNHLGINMQGITTELYRSGPPQYCYAYIRKRPREQRADAVQARLAQADRMTAAFEPDLLTVDLIGDHANILSLEFLVRWPDESRVRRVSSIVEGYFASVDIEDYVCGAGFAEVRLSARNVFDQTVHPIWTAHVTSEGLLKSTMQQASLH